MDIASLPWFHSIDLGGGIVTPGKADIATLKAQADIYFRDSLSGKSVLDIGCWDGFNSFEAKRRGASRVLATDFWAWRKGWGSKDCFEVARSRLALDIEEQEIDAMDISPETVGSLDIVLFLGVFYHLRNPFLGLEKAASVCKETLVVETHIERTWSSKPKMIFYPTNELNGDGSNWWGPNPPCIMAMLKDLGFKPEFVEHPLHKSRGIFFGRR